MMEQNANGRLRATEQAIAVLQTQVEQNTRDIIDVEKASIGYHRDAQDKRAQLHVQFNRIDKELTGMSVKTGIVFSLVTTVLVVAVKLVFNI